MRIAAHLTMVLLAATSARAAVSITTCGTTVPPRETGVLAGDLTCPGGLPAITVLARGTLDLAGNTLTTQGAGFAVDCQAGGCTILGGGGAIVAEAGGVLASRRLVLRDVTVDVGAGSMIGGDAVNCLGRIDAANARIVGRTAVAIVGLQILLTDVDVSDSNAGVIGIRKVRGTNVTASGTNNHGVAGGRIRLEGFVAHANVGAGVAGSRVVLSTADVTGNGTGGDGVDVLSGRRPRLIDTTCGMSQVMDAPTGTTWGVCLSD